MCCQIASNQATQINGRATAKGVSSQPNAIRVMSDGFDVLLMERSGGCLAVLVTVEVVRVGRVVQRTVWNRRNVADSRRMSFVE